MVAHTSSARAMAGLIGGVILRVSEAAIGIALIIVGAALAITVYLTPLGVFLGVLGFTLFLCAQEGFRMCRGKVGRRPHTPITHRSGVHDFSTQHRKAA